MLMTSGKHKGKSFELIALKYPDILWDILSSEARSEKQRRVQAEAKRLVNVFNRRAFCVRCVGMDCERPATRCSIRKSDVLSPWWWCDACDPWQYGAGRDILRIVRTYEDALEFSEPFDDPTVARDLIAKLAEAKGLQELKKIQVDIFFNG